MDLPGESVDHAAVPSGPRDWSTCVSPYVWNIRSSRIHQSNVHILFMKCVKNIYPSLRGGEDTAVCAAIPS